MAKKTTIKYAVVVGCNAPDPSGARSLNGQPLEVRFEPGTEIDETAVTPSALVALLAVGAIRMQGAEPIADSEPN